VTQNIITKKNEKDTSTRKKRERATSSAVLFQNAFYFKMRFKSLLSLLLVVAARNTTADSDSDCPCIDSTEILKTRANCVLSNDGDGNVTSVNDETQGFWSYVFGKCVPFTYGANECKPYDLDLDPYCIEHAKQDNFVVGVDDPTSMNLTTLDHAWCYSSFCYVDWEKCRRNSNDELRPAVNVRHLNLEADLFWSYTACNATHGVTESFLEYVSLKPLESANLSIVVPDYWAPAHYKDIDDVDGTITNMESAYYNDDIPWKGWMINYLNDVLKISNIKSHSYTHVGLGSIHAYNYTSGWNAAVLDVKSGTSCLGASLFWTTVERLRLSSFAIPVAMDKVMLWIPNPLPPAVEEKLKPSFWKGITETGLALPFSGSLWLILLLSLITVSLLHIWFSSKDDALQRRHSKLRSREINWKELSIRRRISISCQIIIDSCARNFNHLFSASLDYDMESSASNKILNFGFGLLILVVVAGYTAELAAMLTTARNSNPTYIKDIEDAQANDIAVCGSGLIRTELESKYPKVDWVFHKEDPTWLGVIENYDTGKCRAIVSSLSDVTDGLPIMEEFCARNLVYTGSEVISIPIAFPVCNKYAAGISSWVLEAARQGVNFEDYQKSGRPSQKCTLSVLEALYFNPDDDDNSNEKLTPADFTLPLLTLLICATVATSIHISTSKGCSKLKHRKNARQGVSEFVPSFRSNAANNGSLRVKGLWSLSVKDSLQREEEGNMSFVNRDPLQQCNTNDVLQGKKSKLLMVKEMAAKMVDILENEEMSVLDELHQNPQKELIN